MNAAYAPGTATSDVLNHYTTEASPKKDAQVVYIISFNSLKKLSISKVCARRL